MSLSNEYFDHHLTPTGWRCGTSKLDFGGEVRPVPVDCLLTVQENRYLACWGADEDVDLTETWRSTDSTVVAEAISKYGGEPIVTPGFKFQRSNKKRRK